MERGDLAESREIGAERHRHESLSGVHQRPVTGLPQIDWIGVLVTRKAVHSASLTARPPVLLLDEPTTGLDPRTRQELWSAVDELRRDGTTVLLTTQYLEEADRLAQGVAIVDHGRIAAQGTAAELKATVGTDVLVVRIADPASVADAVAALADLAAGEEPLVDNAAGEIRLAVAHPSASAEAVRRLDARGVPIAAVELAQPSLDDVFVTLTGRRAEEQSTDQRPEQEAA
jgi:ABC-type multidrug transport system ATPase subunit